MDRNGVDKALVSHGNAEAAGALFGNDALLELIRADTAADRLTGVWTVLPGQCAELPPPAELFAKMAANGVGALNLYPVAHRWQACRLTIGRLMDAAAERQVPVIVQTTAMDGGWRGVYDFMRAFPAATVIVSKLGLWGADRNIRPLLENFPGCHIELSEYWVPEGIADLVRLYGADRLLYASGYPRFGHGSTMLSIRHGGLTTEQVRMIAGHNLERLLAHARLA
ncbi:MAG: amidohydrolase family protein, partial [Lentisphaeria bacterium]|nr:amidohydrolase family protein [Lentisphaeria bacterium]